jgi:DNA repair exonuclease SbcCD ATPase subunit
MIGLSLEAFCNTVIIAQGEDLFLDLPPRAKLSLLADVLDLDRWEKRSQRASKASDGHAFAISSLIGEISGLTATQQRLTDMLTSAQLRAKEWMDERADRLKDQAGKRAMLEKMLETAQTALDKATLAHDGAGTEAKALRAVQTKLRDELTAVVHHVRERDRLQRELDHLEVGEGDQKCPTCGQGLKGTPLGKHRDTMLHEIAKLEPKVKQCANLQKAIISNDGILRAFEDKEANVQSAINRFLPEVTELKTKLTMLKDQTKIQANEANPFTEQVQKLRRQVTQVEVEISTKQDEQAKVAKDLELTKFWVKGFKDVQLFVIEEVLAEIEVACNAMLPDVGLDGWEMRFAVERETASGTTQRGLNVTVLSPYNSKPVKWECWGGGVGQRQRIIATLALSEVLLAAAGIETNMEVLDEPTKHLSTEGTQDLCDFLAERAATLGRATWWVDHQVVESSRFAGVVTVVRGKEGSYIT